MLLSSDKNFSILKLSLCASPYGWSWEAYGVVTVISSLEYVGEFCLGSSAEAGSTGDKRKGLKGDVECDECGQQKKGVETNFEYIWNICFPDRGRALWLVEWEIETRSRIFEVFSQSSWVCSGGFLIGSQPVFASTGKLTWATSWISQMLGWGCRDSIELFW